MIKNRCKHYRKVNINSWVKLFLPAVTLNLECISSDFATTSVIILKSVPISAADSCHYNLRQMWPTSSRLWLPLFIRRSVGPSNWLAEISPYISLATKIVWGPLRACIPVWPEEVITSVKQRQSISLGTLKALLSVSAPLLKYFPGWTAGKVGECTVPSNGCLIWQANSP